MAAPCGPPRHCEHATSPVSPPWPRAYRRTPPPGVTAPRCHGSGRARGSPKCGATRRAGWWVRVGGDRTNCSVDGLKQNERGAEACRVTGSISPVGLPCTHRFASSGCRAFETTVREVGTAFFFKLLCTFPSPRKPFRQLSSDHPPVTIGGREEMPGSPVSHRTSGRIWRQSDSSSVASGSTEVVAGDGDGGWLAELAGARDGRQCADCDEIDADSRDGDAGRPEFRGLSSLGRLSGRPERLVMTR